MNALDLLGFANAIIAQDKRIEELYAELTGLRDHTFRDEKMYHFYLDEGGLMGRPKRVVSLSPLPEDEREGAIVNYYVGYMPARAITTYINHINALWDRLGFSDLITPVNFKDVK